MQQRVTYAGHSAGPQLANVAAVADLIAGNCRPGPVERVALQEAIGRVLAQPIRADRDYPAFNKSMVDGFAVHSADIKVAPVELNVAGQIAAGMPGEFSIGPGQAIRINTGAPVPSSGDAVVMVEHTQSLADGRRIRVDRPAEPGQHVAIQGSDCQRGDVVLDAPVRLEPPQIATAATAGAATVAVYERPELAIVVTGNEVVPLGSPRRDEQIYDSNGPALCALGSALGARVRDLGICGDDRDVLRQAFTAALESPLVVVVGGMSMGTLDLAPGVFETLGVTWQVHGVDMRPGRPFGYGIGPNGQQVFGLPGNPVSAFVCFHLFVRTAISGLSGLPARMPQLLRTRLRTGTRPSKDRRPAYLPARLFVSPNGELDVEAVKWHGSGDSIGLGRANALLHVQAGGAAISAGETALVLPLEVLA